MYGSEPRTVQRAHVHTAPRLGARFAVKSAKWGRNFTMQPRRASTHDLVLGRRLVMPPYKARECEATADRQIAQRRRAAHTYRACITLRRHHRRLVRTAANHQDWARDARAATLSAHRVANPLAWPLIMARNACGEALATRGLSLSSDTNYNTTHSLWRVSARHKGPATYARVQRGDGQRVTRCLTHLRYRFAICTSGSEASPRVRSPPVPT